MKSKIIPVVLLVSLVVLLASSAGGRIGGIEPKKIPTNNLNKGDCKGTPTYPDPDSIVITVSGNDIIVQHFDAFYNCCLTISTQVEQNGYDINLYESETGDYPCYCLCYYDLETTIHDLDSGTYTVSVYNAEGEYVGGGTATIQGGKAPDPLRR
jgi:hypothetical protein